jgi:hypothetical protein
MADKLSTDHFALGVNIAIEALKSLLFVNGGAATALVALADKTKGSLDYGLPVLLFGCAALLNATTLVVGYFSQLTYANHTLAIEQSEHASAEALIKMHARLQHVAILLLIFSMAFSVGGMATAFRATSSV